MKTTIWTAYNLTQPPMSDAERPRCIFSGDIPILLRKGDQITVLDGYCVERVDNVYYSIPDGSQEVHLVTSDIGKEYPTVEMK